ncbi:hypothetical protein QJS10_CPA03g02582 [Acorus calamus]|uniref:FACT complex subunit n=1 Tax=Acorus calamus TaxID=4465 RepID=A0AAV9F7E4_ACOCL|nr:hypothetical protein QJS10_CPA03g02582 [Acorus calamus]
MSLHKEIPKSASKMDQKKFKKKIKSLYSHWDNNTGGSWADVEILIVSTSSDRPFSSAFFRWMLGRDLPDTTAVMTYSKIHFLCPPEQAGFLRSLRSVAVNAVFAGVVVYPATDQEGRTRLMEVILREVVADLRCPSVGGPVVPIVAACVGKERPRESGFGTYSLKARAFEFDWRDVTVGLSRFVRVREGGADEEKLEVVEGGGDDLMEGIEESKVAEEEWVVISEDDDDDVIVHNTSGTPKICVD